MSIIKSPYEISLWRISSTAVEYVPADNFEENTIYYILENDNHYTTEFDETVTKDNFIKGKYYIKVSYYPEYKELIIGSDTMSTQWRAVEPKLVENANGTNTFTFKMFYRYEDIETGKMVLNPVINKIHNESKIKVYWENKWYDLLVKNRQEDSGGKSVTFTCKDSFVTELGKTGFNLEFSTELGNNMGTADELARAVVEETEWQVEDTAQIVQKIDENFYSVTIENALSNIVKLTQDYESGIITKEQINLGAGTILGIFYTQVPQLTLEKTEDFTTVFAFDYNDEQEVVNRTTLEINNWYELPITWKLENYSENSSVQVRRAYVGDTVIFDIATEANLVSGLRAQRLVKSQTKTYDPVIEKYCNVYEVKDNISNDSYLVYEDESSIFSTPSSVKNLITNPDNFTSIVGWKSDKVIITTSYAYDGTTNGIQNVTSFLRVPKDAIVRNSGIKDFITYHPEGFIKGEEYIFRVAIFADPHDEGGNVVNGLTDNYINSIRNGEPGALWMPTVYLAPVPNSESDYSQILTGDNYFQKVVPHPNANSAQSLNSYKFPAGKTEKTDPYYQAEIRLRCTETVTAEQIKNEEIGFFFQSHYYYDKTQEGNTLYTNFELFKVIHDAAGNILEPGDITSNITSNRVYGYYKYNENNTKDNLNYIYRGVKPITTLTEEEREQFTIDNLTFTPYYGSVTDYNPENTNDLTAFNKVRSIEAKQSNRFNILQDIAETFGCWLRFRIEYTENGEIKRINGRPQKFIQYTPQVGQKTGLGFVYGIDLKTISRIHNSDNIATKVIVSPSNNQYAENSICQISNSRENYTKENFILNFDYYINKGMLDKNRVQKDLYDYENALNSKNNQYYDNINVLMPKQNELTKLEGELTVAIAEQSAALTDCYEAISEFSRLTGIQYTSNDTVTDIDLSLFFAYVKEHPSNFDAIAKYQRIDNSKKIYNDALSEVTQLNEAIDNLKKSIVSLEGIQEEIIKALTKIHKDFNAKYLDFIQEGTWQSDDYIDENLYYLDATEVSQTSAFPKTTYNISVIRLNALEEFKNKKFHIGDNCFIEDVEFFGYSDIKTKTPYRLDVVLTEKTSWFDSPEKDTFKVQNYRDQFQDLFQKVTAMSQALDFSKGNYQRAADAISGSGVVKAETLQDSFKAATALALSARTEEVITDKTGITLTDKSNPKNVAKVTSLGYFLSSDGGVTFKNAIRGGGITAQSITSGTLNVENVTLAYQEEPAFRWNRYGISAYDWQNIEDNTNFNLKTFVRFDKFGLYGINNISPDKLTEGEYVPVDIADIEENANFALTWNGLFIKTSDGTGGIRVSPNYDILVQKNTDDIITIGRLFENGEVSGYGLRLVNPSSGGTVLQFKTNKDNNDASFSLDGVLEIGNISTNNFVKIGVTGNMKENSIKEVINANNKFIVYEDGSVKATDGVFTGTIEAKGGTIGPLSIAADGVLLLQGQSDQSMAIVGNGQSGSGVYINNLPFTIKGTNGELIFKDGNLSITGNINAVSGNFSGELKSPTGNIGGFIIEEEQLYSTGEIYSEADITSENFNDNKNSLYILNNETNQYEQLSDDVIYDENITYYMGTPAVYLEGINGAIKANNLEIRENATITGFIKIGSDNDACYIYNPYWEENDDNVFIKAGRTIIKNNGIIELNNNSRIVINPEGEPSIKATGVDGRLAWNIDSQGAIFSNLSTDYSIYKNTYYSQNGTQTVGGSILFQPTTKITQWYEFGYFLDRDGYQLRNTYAIKIQDEIIKTDGSCYKLPPYISNSFLYDYYGVVIELSGEDPALPHITTTIFNVPHPASIDPARFIGWNYAINPDLVDTIGIETLKKYNTITILCSIKGDSNLIIGINSIDNPMKNYSASLLQSGISITEYNTQLDSYNRVETINGYVQGFIPNKPKVFLGNLDNLSFLKNNNESLGYGLYTNNCILTGSLTTGSVRGSYAGVNTNSDLYYETRSNGKIIFWGGAADDSTEGILKAPFIVTDKGYLYASKGVFSGEIEGSKIYGTEIYAAKLFGYNKNSKDYAPLTIYDTTASSLEIDEMAEKGIVFKGNFSQTEAPNYQRVLQISDKNIIANDKIIIDFYNNKNIIKNMNNVISNVITAETYRNYDDGQIRDWSELTSKALTFMGQNITVANNILSSDEPTVDIIGTLEASITKMAMILTVEGKSILTSTVQTTQIHNALKVDKEFTIGTGYTNGKNMEYQPALGLTSNGDEVVEGYDLYIYDNTLTEEVTWTGLIESQGNYVYDSTEEKIYVQ